MRLLIGLSLLVIFFLICGIYVSQQTLSLITDMRETVSEIGMQINNNNWVQAQQITVQLQKHWNNIQDRWDFYIMHQEIENVEMLLARLASFVFSEDESSSSAELAALDMQLSHIYRKEIFNIQNIF